MKNPRWKIVEYEPKHLEGFVLQPEQARCQAFVDSEAHREWFGALGVAYSGLADGKCVAVFGAYQIEGNYANAWGLVSTEAGRWFPLIHKAVTEFLNVYDCHRMEARIDESFPRGAKWAEMLGFEFEGVLKHQHADGENAYLYARINKKKAVA